MNWSASLRIVLRTLISLMRQAAIRNFDVIFRPGFCYSSIQATRVM